MKMGSAHGPTMHVRDLWYYKAMCLNFASAQLFVLRTFIRSVRSQVPIRSYPLHLCARVGKARGLYEGCDDLN